MKGDGSGCAGGAKLGWGGKVPCRLPSSVPPHPLLPSAASPLPGIGSKSGLSKQRRAPAHLAHLSGGRAASLHSCARAASSWGGGDGRVAVAGARRLAQAGGTRAGVMELGLQMVSSLPEQLEHALTSAECSVLRSASTASDCAAGATLLHLEIQVLRRDLPRQQRDQRLVNASIVVQQAVCVRARCRVHLRFTSQAARGIGLYVYIYKLLS
ncbi:hypothetical protein V8C86DRAFT_2705007 [Haematococcus lacustris]